MKKTLITSLITAGIIGFTNPAYPFEIGDKAPDFSEMKVCDYGLIDGGDKKMVVMNVLEGDKVRYNACFQYCNGKVNRKPFGFFDYKDGKIYLDNCPTDGVIDGFGTIGKSAFEDMPYCGDVI